MSPYTTTIHTTSNPPAMPTLRTQIPIPPNITRVVWVNSHTGYQQYQVKCGCTTSMGTACRRWAIGFRDGTSPVCQAHFTPTPTLPTATIARRREIAATQRDIRRMESVNQRIAGLITTINFIRATITPDMSDAQSRSMYTRIGHLLQHIENIRSGTVGTRVTPIVVQVYAPTDPGYAPTDKPVADEPLPEEERMVEDECPIRMEEYTVIRKAPCGHHACPDCCLQMKAAGRTLKCPLCRDMGFRRLVSYAVPTPAPVMI